jgi:hypothetical protein
MSLRILRTLEFPTQLTIRPGILSKESKEQRQKLSCSGEIESQFAQLKHLDEKSHDTSLIRKGLSRVSPYLQGVKLNVDLATPFLGLEPTAGASINLVNGVLSVSSDRKGEGPMISKYQHIHYPELA